MHVREMESANGSILQACKYKLESIQFRNTEITVIPLLLVQQKN